MKLTWLGHSAVRAENGGHVILIDPFLSQNPKFQGSVDDAAAGATHVVLTHGHDDHVGDAAGICKKTGATLVAPYELAMFLAGQGVDKVQPANPGGIIDLGGGTGASGDNGRDHRVTWGNWQKTAKCSLNVLALRVSWRHGLERCKECQRGRTG